MLKRYWKMLVAMAVGSTSMLMVVQAQQRSSGGAGTLSGQDYAEIQQLIARYSYVLDTCSNDGYDYADLYTDDGVFIDL
jgi:hypothetical protein